MRGARLVASSSASSSDRSILFSNVNQGGEMKSDGSDVYIVWNSMAISLLSTETKRNHRCRRVSLPSAFWPVAHFDREKKNIGLS